MPFSLLKSCCCIRNRPPFVFCSVLSDLIRIASLRSGNPICAPPPHSHSLSPPHSLSLHPRFSRSFSWVVTGDCMYKCWVDWQVITWPLVIFVISLMDNLMFDRPHWVIYGLKHDFRQEHKIRKSTKNFFFLKTKLELDLLCTFELGTRGKYWQVPIYSKKSNMFIRLTLMCIACIHFCTDLVTFSKGQRSPGWCTLGVFIESYNHTKF